MSFDLMNASYLWKENENKFEQCSVIIEGKVTKCQHYIYDKRNYTSTVLTEVFYNFVSFIIPTFHDFQHYS